MTRMATLAAALLILGLPIHAQLPVFSGDPADLVRLDVQVISTDGNPIVGLGAGDFHVALNGVDRPVVAAALVDGSLDRAPTAGVVRKPGVIAPDARVYVLAVDEPGLGPGAPAVVGPHLQRFARRLRPSDVLGVYPFSYSPAPLRLTHERTIAMPLRRVVGRAEAPGGDFQLTASEVAGITADDEAVLQAVSRRACDPRDLACPVAVRQEALARAGALEVDAARRLVVLEELVRALTRLPGRKHVLLVSGGLPTASRVGGRPDLAAPIDSLAGTLANADVLMYVVHWADAERRGAGASGAGLAASGDTDANGLELIAGRSNGSLLRVQNGAGADHVFERILRETSAYYVLGVKISPEDRDGRPRQLRVRVARSGAVVRNRTNVVIPLRSATDETQLR